MGRQNIQIPLDFLSVGWLVIATNNLLESEDDGAIERRNLRFPNRVCLRRKKVLHNLTKKDKGIYRTFSDEFSSLINWSLQLNDDLSSRF
jgi:hypothetical protein